MNEKILILEVLLLLLATVIGHNYQKKMTSIYLIFFLITNYWVKKVDLANNITNIFVLLSLIYISTTIKKLKRTKHE